jgi:hypothetical protein
MGACIALTTVGGVAVSLLMPGVGVGLAIGIIASSMIAGAGAKMVMDWNNSRHHAAEMYMKLLNRCGINLRINLDEISYLSPYPIEKKIHEKIMGQNDMPLDVWMKSNAKSAAESALRDVNIVLAIYRIRRALLDFSMVSIVGRQNAGKSTLIQLLTNPDEKEFEIGFDNHTGQLKAYEKGQLILVDTPGSSSLDSTMVSKASQLISSCQSAMIVMWKYEGDITSDIKHQLRELQCYFGLMPVLILLNQTLSFMPNKSVELKNLDLYRKKIADYAQELMGPVKKFPVVVHCTDLLNSHPSLYTLDQVADWINDAVNLLQDQ